MANPDGKVIFQPVSWSSSRFDGSFQLECCTCHVYGGITALSFPCLSHGMELNILYIIFTYTYRLLRYIFKFGQFMIELFLNKLPFAILLREHISFF